MNTADIPRDLKFYIPLLLEVILESPIKRDGSESSYFIYRENAYSTRKKSEYIIQIYNIFFAL